MMRTLQVLPRSEPVELQSLRERYGNLSVESLRWKKLLEELGTPDDTTTKWMIEQSLGGKGKG
jgi:hypothetical protein